MPRTNRKEQQKPSHKPAIRVSDEANLLGIQIKLLSSQCGVRVYIGDIFSELMLEHGPAIVKKLQIELDKIRKGAKKGAK